jgi:phosphoglycolate phosphatase-like HAD superfamily hydrolase
MADAALFDWDGTLLDSRERLLSAWYASTQEVLGHRWPTSAAEEEMVFTEPGGVLFPKVAGSADTGIALGTVFQRHYESATVPVQAFSGVRTMLIRFRDAGLPTAVVTSKARNRYEADAREAGLLQLLDIAVCEGEAAADKPDPAPVIRALGQIGVPPERAIMAGDTPADVAAGGGAGVPVIAVRWGAVPVAKLLAAGATAVAHDPRELTEIMLGP